MVLMCGATGLLGERVTRRLAARGVALRLLLRDGASDAIAREVGAEVVRGDLRRPGTLRPAVEDADTVVTTATAIGRALDGERVDLRAVDGQGTVALVSAAESAGVQRFVYTSFAGLDDDAARRVPLAAAKRAVERRLAASPMRAVIVRPDSFQELWLSPMTQFDWQRGRVIVFGRGETIARYVATDDVAEAIAVLTVADDPPASVEFGGPEPLTRHEAVQVFEAVTGREIRTHHVPRAALRAGLRVLRRRRPEVASVMGLSLLADERDATWTEEPLRALGIQPRSVTAYAAQVARAA
jgi:NADH dehydrogenase